MEGVGGGGQNAECAHVDLVDNIDLNFTKVTKFNVTFW